MPILYKDEKNKTRSSKKEAKGIKSTNEDDISLLEVDLKRKSDFEYDDVETKERIVFESSKKSKVVK
eukprot:CAMPEP_0171453668 /NCGR_PEP_ID=MMETSP0945-20130129/1278_1 /TAXON_ID=109269 /ORGANISM="Vaucheria litorea, Strain CCMP2940" /LENGTH=66 /DNA_ID=CAMNT_0011978569 /DNA_START=210 /DNA_END=410 /DNA_ORIENTATION=-